MTRNQRPVLRVYRKTMKTPGHRAIVATESGRYDCLFMASRRYVLGSVRHPLLGVDGASEDSSHAPPHIKGGVSMAQKARKAARRSVSKPKKGAERGRTTRDLELTDRDQEAVKGGQYYVPGLTKGGRRMDTRG
jgi:hypothetical protein